MNIKDQGCWTPSWGTTNVLSSKKRAAASYYDGYIVLASIPEMDSANYVTIYRFNNSVGARCYGTSTVASSACSGYSYEREAFIIARTAFTGTFPLAQCNNGTDHILVDMNSADYAQLSNCQQLGYAYKTDSAPTSYPFSHVCGVSRYSYDTANGGSHLFTIGADLLTNMTLEQPKPRFLALSNSTTCSDPVK